MKLKHAVAGMMTAAAAAVLTGCNPDATDPAKEANLVYPNWAEGVAYTHLAKVVLEDKMGYEVEITAADVAPGYTAVAQGSQDAFMECWPALHKDYLDRYSDDLKSLGNVYEGTEVGLAVPAYVTIDTIAELQANAAKFDGKITGVDAGAGMMKTIENELFPAYGLTDIKLLASSGPAMTAALADAVKNEEWIVVTAWRPHWMFGRWDLKFLKQDADKPIWESGNLEIVGRADLEADKPELAQFLKNFFVTDAQISDLMVKIKDSDDDTLTAARQWMLENESTVEKWIPTAN
ncbi:glycine betaine ABC transporter substrate-binding protein [Pontiella agarivorans]|uniref:Glycine betaine ABC transporter substrate-binding protein n=1 Tax=Pontiella agarivorans TaxID=3038953 RepID=A0ABU5MVJ7_9BACT|nr:glycine betaine ABC transporter substrate-binding protein [Pontiella agarivorans]MDZ8118192.1 glycine betaine ABC transporter substrate-binding protein [Pontiella agarivorans]